MTLVDAQPSALARSIAMELVTKYRLRLADQRDARLGSLAGQYEMALAAWSGDRGVLVALYEPPSDALAASADLEARCRYAQRWGTERLTVQRAQTCDVLIVALGKVRKTAITPPPKGPVSVGAVAIDPGSGQAETLLPVPQGLPSKADLQRVARTVGSGQQAPTVEAIDLAANRIVESSPKKPAPVRTLAKTPVVTYSLIGIFIAVFVMEKVLITPTSSIGLFDLGALINVAGTHLMDRYDPTAGAWWRYVSAAFLHDDQSFAHVLFNSFAMWNIGRFAEIWYGRLVLLGTFLLTAVAGGVTWVVLTSNSSAYGLTIGASGGITGLMGLLILVGRVQGKQFPRATAASVRSWIAINAALILFMGVTGLGGVVNNYAHVGGFVAGMGLALVLPPRAAIGGRDLRKVESTALALVIAIALVALGYDGVHVQSVIGSTKWVSVTGQYRSTATVGETSEFMITVKNVGSTPIENLTILMDEGDRFLDLYTVVSSGPCTVDKSLPGLACGPLAPGAVLAFTMTAQPRATGHFTFKFHVGDGVLYLRESSGDVFVYGWTQTID